MVTELLAAGMIAMAFGAPLGYAVALGISLGSILVVFYLIVAVLSDSVLHSPPPSSLPQPTHSHEPISMRRREPGAVALRRSERLRSKQSRPRLHERQLY